MSRYVSFLGFDIYAAGANTCFSSLSPKSVTADVPLLLLKQAGKFLDLDVESGYDFTGLMQCFGVGLVQALKLAMAFRVTWKSPQSFSYVFLLFIPACDGLEPWKTMITLIDYLVSRNAFYTTIKPDAPYTTDHTA